MHTTVLADSQPKMFNRLIIGIWESITWEQQQQKKLGEEYIIWVIRWWKPDTYILNL